MLALHAMACVAGFMAGSSLPIVAQGHTGWWRRVHDRAGKLAIAFVALATLFSLSTQAYALGATPRRRRRPRHVARIAADRAAAPRAAGAGRAVPAARRLDHRQPARRLEQLLAATFVTTAIAVPVLVAAAAFEVWVTPHVLYFLK